MRENAGNLSGRANQSDERIGGMPPGGGEELSGPQQMTIQQPVFMEGVGLHTGRAVRMVVKPGKPDSGFTFVRTDRAGSPEIKASVENIAQTVRCTTLGRGGEAEVQTVEHLLAALAGLGIDNAVIELDAPEVPVADGSAAAFVALLERAGMAPQQAPKRILSLPEAVWITGKDSHIVALPADTFKVSFVFTNRHPAVGNQYAEFVLEPQSFQREIAPARTIGFMHEIEALQKQGLALGGNLDIAVVVGEEGYLSPPRFPDEIVRHKILDLIGDLAVLGPLHAHIIGLRSGHSLDALLAKKIQEVASG